MASVASQLTQEATAHAQSDSLEDAREICADGTYFPNNLRMSHLQIALSSLLRYQYPTSSPCCHLTWTICTPWNQSECVFPWNSHDSLPCCAGWLSVVTYFSQFWVYFNEISVIRCFYIFRVVIYDAFVRELSLVFGNWERYNQKPHVSLHVKGPLFFSDFNQIRIFPTDFRKKNSQISNFIKIRVVGAELFSAHRRTDGRSHRYVEANSRF